MRLLYLTTTSAMGGAERVLLDLLGIVRRAQPSWKVGLIVGNDGPLADAARDLGIETAVLPFPRELASLGDAGAGGVARWTRFGLQAVLGSLATCRYGQRLRVAVAGFRPDVVHTNGIKMHVLGALVRPARTALVWHFHDYPGSRPVTGRLIRALRFRCTSVVAVSSDVAADVRTLVGEGTPISTVWNSVDLLRFAPVGPFADLDALAGLDPAPAGTIRIGLVATFARWKGHGLFLEMLSRLPSEVPFRGYIVGGPLYETHASQTTMSELRAHINRLGLSTRVGLTGFTDAAEALRSLDVVIHASSSAEPFGLVVAEAMAAGRAVVISDAGGVAELVADEQTGLLYRSGDVDGMTRQAQRVLEDRRLRQRLGRAAHRAAVEQFDQDRMCRQMLDVYIGAREAVA